jgi:hypothetical protein
MPWARNFVAVRKPVADARFFIVGNSRQAHGRQGDVMLPVCCYIYDGVGADRIVPGVALREVEGASVSSNSAANARAYFIATAARNRDTCYKAWKPESARRPTR